MNEETVISEMLAARLRLCSVAWNVLRDRQQAEDLFQETVIKAVQRTDGFEDIDHLLGWAVVTIRNAAIDLVRQRQTRSALLEEMALQKLDENRSLDARGGYESDRLDALLVCAQRLPKESRDLLHRRYHEGKSGEEIAEELNISRDAVYKRLSRIHQQLRDKVEAELSRWQSSPSPEPAS